jgi:hypothetical protein
VATVAAAADSFMSSEQGNPDTIVLVHWLWMTRRSWEPRGQNFTGSNVMTGTPESVVRISPAEL